MKSRFPRAIGLETRSKEWREFKRMCKRVKEYIKQPRESLVSTGKIYKNESGAYYNSEEWQAQKERIVKRDGYRCTECGRGRNLQVHHTVYKGVSKEDKDCTTLCIECHAKKHPKNAMKILLKYEPTRFKHFEQ